MPQRIYIETTIVSYLTAHPSRDLIVAAHQQITHDWWNYCRTDYEHVFRNWFFRKPATAILKPLKNDLTSWLQ
jgi:hypothetical protein